MNRRYYFSMVLFFFGCAMQVLSLSVALMAALRGDFVGAVLNCVAFYMNFVVCGWHWRLMKDIMKAIKSGHS